MLKPWPKIDAERDKAIDGLRKKHGSSARIPVIIELVKPDLTKCEPLRKFVEAQTHIVGLNDKTELLLDFLYNNDMDQDELKKCSLSEARAIHVLRLMTFLSATDRVKGVKQPYCAAKQHKK